MKEPVQPRAPHMARRVLNALFALFAAIGDIAVALMVLVTVVEIVMRQVFNLSTHVADEYSGYLLVVATFFGLSAAVRTQSLFRFDNLLALLPGRARDLYVRLLYGIAFCTGAVICWRVWGYATRSLARGVISDGYYPIPLWIIQIAMPIGMTVMLVAILEKIVSPQSESE